MKAQLLLLSAAGLMLSASAAYANSSASEHYVEAVRQAAQARLADKGVDVAGKPITVQLGVGADRISGVRIAKSSGSPDLDAQTLSALRGLKIGVAPAELVGRNLTLSLGEGSPRSADLSAR